MWRRVEERVEELFEVSSVSYRYLKAEDGKARIFTHTLYKKAFLASLRVH